MSSLLVKGRAASAYLAASSRRSSSKRSKLLIELLSNEVLELSLVGNHRVTIELWACVGLWQDVSSAIDSR